MNYLHISPSNQPLFGYMHYYKMNSKPWYIAAYTLEELLKLRNLLSLPIKKLNNVQIPNLLELKTNLISLKKKFIFGIK